MRKSLSKVLSALIFLSTVTPSSAKVFAVDMSTKPVDANITVTNNVVVYDTVKVTGLVPTDVVKIYSAAINGSLLGKATVPTDKTDVTVTIPQLGSKAGNVYVSVSSVGKQESDTTAKAYSEEVQSQALGTGSITVINNAGIADVVKVTGLLPTDVIKVYSAETGGTAIGTATVLAGKTEVSISIPKLPADSGSVYVTRKSTGANESNRTAASYVAEATSTSPASGAITILNNATGKSDTITVTGLVATDIVKVYSATTGGTLLGKATVAAAKTEVTVTIPQVGVVAGSVFVSVSTVGKKESDRTTKAFNEEVQSQALGTGSITVTNNAGIADTVKVTGLLPTDVIKVYSAETGGTAIGTATVLAGKTEVSISIPKLPADSGSVYVTRKSTGANESNRTAASYVAEATSTSPALGAIAVLNNATGKSDTITVTGLVATDIVKVYSAKTGGTLLGKATVAAAKTEVTVTIPQVGVVAGSVFVSVSTVGKKESERITKEFSEEAQSQALGASSITVTNNAGIADAVKVTGLSPTDVIKVYSAETGGTAIGTATVLAGKTEVSISIPKLPADSGSVYVTRKSTGANESNRTAASYVAEATSTSPALGAITVLNNATGKSDTITVTGLVATDIVKVYSAKTGGTLLGKATVAAAKTEVTVTIPQVGVVAGSVFVSVSSVGKKESERITKEFSEEAQSQALGAGSITVTNNAGIADTVKVTGLLPTDVIKVYSAETGGTAIGTATVLAGKTEVLISIPKLPADSGSVYVTRKSAEMNESTRTPASYLIEATSTSPAPESITVLNNATGKPDTITVTGLVATDIVKVYSAKTGGTLLGKATVAAAKTEVTVTIPQVGVVAGSVFVSVSSVGKKESERITKEFSEEAQSQALGAGSITVTNNAGIADTVKVTGLLPTDVIKVYSAETGGTAIGTAMVLAGKTEVLISIPKLPAESGSVYITRKSAEMNESTRTPASYLAEAISTSPAEDSITVLNNATGKPDTITVTDLVATDIVKVYSATSGGTLLGNATVAADKTEVTVTIPQLGVAAGSVFVSVSSLGKKESERTTKAFSQETQSDSPIADSITITNNAGIADTVKVTGLLPTDVIKVYSTETGGTAIGTATVLAGKTEVLISIPKLPADSGSVYVTRKSAEMNESTRTSASYLEEAISTSPAEDSITVVNNITGKSDTITVTGLVATDIVKVYSATTDGTLLGNATVALAKNEVTVTVPQVGVADGSVFVSVTNLGKRESERTTRTFSKEVQSQAPEKNSITVTNNAGIPDTVKVTDLVPTDIVKIYSVATGGVAIGTATVLTGNTEVLVKVGQLPVASGDVYVTVIRSGMNESTRTPANYIAEPKSEDLAADNIAIINNSAIADSIKVIGLVENDVVKVYSSATGGTLLGTGTVPVTRGDVSVIVPQLSEAEGIVYVTVIKYGKLESNRVEKTYAAEPITNPLEAEQIIVTNNGVIPDTVTIIGLIEANVVKVYSAEVGGALLGTAIVAPNVTTATINIPQLGTASGNVYVSVTNPGQKESKRIAQTYNAEVKSDSLLPENIEVNYAAEIASALKVTGLMENDVVKIYFTEITISPIATSTVVAGKTDVTVSVSQLDKGGGAVYVTVTRYGKTESDRIKVEYT